MHFAGISGVRAVWNSMNRKQGFYETKQITASAWVIPVLAFLSLMPAATAKNKDTNPADYPLTAVVVSVTAPNTESADGTSTNSRGGTATVSVSSSTAARAEIQIGNIVYLVGLPHECGSCIHRTHINLSAGETLHAQLVKDNQKINILREKDSKTEVESFDVKGSHVVQP
jgi:hypothetical protein